MSLPRWHRGASGRWRPGHWVLTAGLALGVTGCGSERDVDGVVVGVVLDYSGSDTADGFLVERGAVLAKELFESARSPEAEPVRLSFRDAQGDPETAARVARELVDDGAVAVVGPSFDGLVRAVGDTLNEADVLLVSPTATTGLDASTSDPWMRMSPGNSTGSSAATLFGQNLAKSLLDRDVQRVGVVIGGDIYNQEFSSAFVDSYTRLGGDATAAWRVPEDISLAQAANQIARNDDELDGVVLAIELLPAATLITEADVAAQRTIAWFLTPRLKSEVLLANTPFGALERSLGIAPNIAALRDGCAELRPEQCFLQQHLQRFGDSPADDAYFMYDATALVLTAIDRLLRSDDARLGRQSLMQEMQRIASRGGVQFSWNEFETPTSSNPNDLVQFVGLTGPIIVDPDGTRRSGNTVLWQVREQAIVPLSD